MRDVLLPDDLRRQGVAPNQWGRMSRKGDLVRLRRGAFVWPSDRSDDDLVRHRQLINANLSYLSSESVISHTSAALLHGLPVWPAELAAVHLTRSRSFGGRIGSSVHVYPAPLRPGEIVELHGIPVTSLARTVVDIARHSSLRRGVAVADAALRLGLSPEELAATATLSRRRPGIVRARRAVAMADPLSESVGESYSRVVFVELRLPPTHLQFEVFDDLGRFVGRSDFCWDDRHTLGEFDGKIKYGGLVPAGSSASEVVIAEKRREDALRETGREVVRWTWNELGDPRKLGTRLERAFARAAGRH